MAGLIIVLCVALVVALNIAQGYRGRGQASTKNLRARRRRSLWASGAGDTSAGGGGCGGGGS